MELWTFFEMNLKNFDADMLIDWCKIGNNDLDTNDKYFYIFIYKVKDIVDDIKLGLNTGFQEWRFIF